MPSTLLLAIVFITSAGALLPAAIPAATAQPKIEINITAPTPGATVGREMIVRGTATLPPGHYLWVLARREDFSPLYWPQREAVVDFGDKTWKAVAVFGGPQDVDWTFDVLVAAFDAQGHAKLKEYWVKAMQSGEWRPMEIPIPKARAAMKVKKVRH